MALYVTFSLELFYWGSPRLGRQLKVTPWCPVAIVDALCPIIGTMESELRRYPYDASVDSCALRSYFFSDNTVQC